MSCFPPLNLKNSVLKIIFAVGSDVSQETVDSVAVFLFNLFATNEAYTRSCAEEIRRTLGPFPAGAASDACNIVRRIVSLVPEGCSSLTVKKECQSSEEFGKNITFKHMQPMNFDNRREDSDRGYDSLSDDEAAKNSDLIISLFNDSEASSHPSSSLEDVPSVPSGQKASSKCTGEWLKEKCQSCVSMGEMEWQDLYSAVFELLSSAEDNSTIQNDVSENWCGYEFLSFSVLV